MIDNFIEFISKNWVWFLLILSLFVLSALLIFRTQWLSKKQLEIEIVCLDEANFSGSDFTNGSFEDMSVQRAKFIKANLSNVVFNNVNLTGSDFSEAILNNTKFINCIMNDVIIDKSQIKILNPELN